MSYNEVTDIFKQREIMRRRKNNDSSTNIILSINERSKRNKEYSDDLTSIMDKCNSLIQKDFSHSGYIVSKKTDQVTVEIKNSFDSFDLHGKECKESLYVEIYFDTSIVTKSIELNNYVSFSGNIVKIINPLPINLHNIGEPAKVRIKNTVLQKIEKNENCFIATAVYGNYNAPEVKVLRKFRDNFLLKSLFGVFTIEIYYKISPFIAKRLRSNTILKKMIRLHLLNPFVKLLKEKGY